MLRREGRNSLVCEFFARHTDRISDGEDTRVKYTDDIAGVCFINNMTVTRHHLLRLGKTHFLSSLHMEDFHSGVEFAGADAHECDTVTVCFVHVCLDFKDKRREILFDRIDHAAVCRTRKRRHRHREEVLQESLHTKVGERRSEEYRGELSLADKLLVKLCTCAVEQLDLIHKLFFLVLIDHIEKMRIVDIDFFLDTFLCSLHCIGEGKDFLFVTVVNTAEFLSGTDRPVDRAGCNAELFFDLVEQLEGIVRIAVHLVDEGKDRDVAHDTDFKQLSGLCLDTLRCIDNHDGGIGCHQGTVRILREVLVSRGIQNVDAVAVVIELQNGRGNGNTTLFLDLHPVGYGMARSRFSFYGTGEIDRSSVQQEFLSQCGFTGIRVGNDGKGTPSFNFFCIIRHSFISFGI